MGARKMHIAAPCPACGVHTVEYTTMDLDLPYFGDVIQLLFECETCGYRHADVIVGTTHEPMRSTYECKTPDDLMVRVIRSTSGTVRIPELGVLIEPGPASEAFVTNVEGILVRVEAILDQLWRDAEDDATKRACEERVAMFQGARAGTLPYTLILEDPLGNSRIVHDRATTERLTREEADRLPRGEISFDISDLEPT